MHFVTGSRGSPPAGDGESGVVDHPSISPRGRSAGLATPCVTTRFMRPAATALRPALRHNCDMTVMTGRWCAGTVVGMTPVQLPTGRRTAAVSPAAPPVAAPPASYYIPALDGLRGLAITGVLLFHTGHLSGGFLGVDLFFVLSGFLITGLLLREVETRERVSLSSFWARRVRRLFPALAVMLAAVALAVWALERAGYAAASPSLVRGTLSDGFWVQLNLINWRLLALDANYWDTFGQSRVFEHLWSIAVEEQFYLVWPLIIVLSVGLLRRWRTQGARALGVVVAITAVVLSVVSLVMMIVLLEPGDPSRVYTGTDTRAFSLLLGATAATKSVATALRRLLRWLGRAAGVFIGLLGTGILVFWFLADGIEWPWLFTGGLFAHALASALLIGLIAEATAARTSTQPSPQARLPLTVLGARPLRWLGRVSYSLYLWHWPVIVVLPAEVIGLSPATYTALVLAVSLILATTSTFLIEDPIRMGPAWTRGPLGAVALLATAAGLLLLWFTLPPPAPPAIDLGDL